jgi:flagellar basal body-associated protein FliL
MKKKNKPQIIISLLIILIIIGIVTIQSVVIAQPGHSTHSLRQFNNELNLSSTTVTKTPQIEDEICAFSQPDCGDETIIESDHIYSDLSNPQLADIVIILFWMQDCVHCEEVLNNVLPDIRINYKEQISIIPIEIIEIEEVDRFYQMAGRLGVPKNKIGVPLILIGNQILTGDQIKPDLHTWIDYYLQEEFVPIPAIPEFAEQLLESIREQQNAPSNLKSSDKSINIGALLPILLIGLPILLLVVITFYILARRLKTKD